jgi:cell division protein FtsB
MSDPTYDQKSLVQYLLGLLPEAEAERLDELSIADDSFAVKLEAAENDLVDSYVRDELTGDALEQFRNHYLASPTRREKVKFASALQEFGEPAAVSAIESRPRDKSSSKRGWLAGIFEIPAFQWGISFAMLALLLVGGWLVIDNTRLRRQSAESIAKQNELAQREQELRAELEGQRNAGKQTEQELAQLRTEQQSHIEQQKPSETGLIATLFLTPQLRGARQLSSVRIEPTTKSVAAHLSLEPNDFASYRVTLIDQANHRTLWSSGVLKARTTGDTKVLSIKFPAKGLTLQSYALRVSGVAAGGPSETISDYPFKVVK